MTLIPFTEPSAIDVRAQEEAVSKYLERARDFLSTAVEMTGPEQIANAKAEIATAAEATKQLHLSKEIQFDALEMVRRAEYALGKAIRKGQAEGTVATRDQAIRDAAIEREARRRGEQIIGETHNLPRITDLAGREELIGNGAGLLHMADGIEPEQFEQALDEAKAEGNLSRANVVRKVKGQTSGAITRDMRAEMIQGLAAQGYSSRQMPEKVGVAEERIREIARAYNIEIPADKVMGKTRRHDSNRIARETVNALEGLAMGADLIDYADIDQGEAAHWATSLDESLKVLNRFRKQIKEMTQ